MKPNKRPGNYWIGYRPRPKVMTTLFFLILSLMVITSPCLAESADRTALYSVKGFPVASSEAGPLDIPDWAIHIPEDSFVGISSPCSNLETARQQALDSAIGQILQAMGADYRLSHESRLTGDLNHSRHELRETLSYTARWLLNSVQQNIKQYAFRNTLNGQVCFVLVQVSASELEKLKTLTIGAKLTARLVGKNGEQILVEVSETNGVGTTFTEYRINLTMTNNHARIITLFFLKVPESENRTLDGALANRLFLKNGSGRVVIQLPPNRTDIRSLFMGSKKNLGIFLTGYDEIGRTVSVPVRLQ